MPGRLQILGSRFLNNLSTGTPTVNETSHSASALLDLILDSLDEDQAEDVVSIDLAQKSEIADHMVIASGRSQRHVGAIADHLVSRIKDAGFGKARVEGLPACDWVLLDGVDVIVHVFRPEVRDFYNLEKLWSPERPAERAAV